MKIPTALAVAGLALGLMALNHGNAAPSPTKPPAAAPPGVVLGAASSVTVTKPVCRGPLAHKPAAAKTAGAVPLALGQYRMRTGSDGYWHGYRDRFAITTVNSKRVSVAFLPGRYCGPPPVAVR